MDRTRKKKKNLQPRHHHLQARSALSSFSSTLLNYLIVAVLIAVFIYLCSKDRFIQDDTYITLRYVRNFIDGKGLVFNHGEHVEGYTCFLWVMLLSGAALLHIDLETAAQNGSVFFGILALIAVYGLSRVVLGDVRNSTADSTFAICCMRHLALLPVLMLVLTNAFSFWTISGMETALFTFLMVSGLYLYLKSHGKKQTFYLSVLLFLLASLTRPEGLMVFVLVMAHNFIFTIRASSSPSHLTVRNIVSRETAIGLALFIIPYTIFTGFRLYYYGYLFPNTFYAKTGFSMIYLKTGVDYFLSFAQSYLLYGFIAVAPLSLLFIQKSERYRISLLVLVSGMYVMYVIVIGGDVLHLHRFFLPVLPVIYILWVAFIKQILTGAVKLMNGTVWMLLPVGISVVCLAIPVFTYVRNIDRTESVRYNEKMLVFRMKDQASWLKKQQEKRNKNISVACTTIGAIAYFSGVTVIDMLGLTDSYISHHPEEIKGISDDTSVTWKERNYNADYILERKPDYILFSTGLKPSAFAERAIFSKREFFRNYYVQLVSSDVFSQNNTFYTKKTPEQLAMTKPYEPNLSYDVSFVGNYIQAVNLLPSLEKTMDTATAARIQKLCETVIRTCPQEFGDAYRILGEMYFRKEENSKGVGSMLKAVEIDDFNSYAHYILYTIFRFAGYNERSEYHFRKLRMYSPYLSLSKKSRS